MPDIMVLLACLSQCVEPTPLRQLGRVIEAMLSMSGRVTMRGLSRWSGKGGSYRTIQRLCNTSLNWCHLNWLLIRHHVLDADDVVVMSGDHVVVTKAGKRTYGLDRFFSSLYGKTVPGRNRSAYENRGHAAACDFWSPSGSRDGASSPHSAASCAAVR
jgi:putative transposase